MPIYVYGSTSGKNEKNRYIYICTKAISRNIYIENNMEEHIDSKNPFGKKIYQTPLALEKQLQNHMLIKKNNDPSIIRQTAHVDLYDKVLIMLVLSQ